MILSANYLVLVDCMTDMWLVVYTSENFGTFVNLLSAAIRIISNV